MVLWLTIVVSNQSAGRGALLEVFHEELGDGVRAWQDLHAARAREVLIQGRRQHRFSRAASQVPERAPAVAVSRRGGGLAELAEQRVVEAQAQSPGSSRKASFPSLGLKFWKPEALSSWGRCLNRPTRSNDSRSISPYTSVSASSSDVPCQCQSGGETARRTHSSGPQLISSHHLTRFGFAPRGRVKTHASFGGQVLVGGLRTYLQRL